MGFSVGAGPRIARVRVGSRGVRLSSGLGPVSISGGMGGGLIVGMFRLMFIMCYWMIVISIVTLVFTGKLCYVAGIEVNRLWRRRQARRNTQVGQAPWRN
jgi:uncharacterized oligopeptide transporter (OPT) family protein